jgi:hypothetical protein
MLLIGKNGGARHEDRRYTQAMKLWRAAFPVSVWLACQP